MDYYCVVVFPHAKAYSVVKLRTANGAAGPQPHVSTEKSVQNFRNVVFNITTFALLIDSL